MLNMRTKLEIISNIFVEKNLDGSTFRADICYVSS